MNVFILHNEGNYEDIKQDYKIYIVFSNQSLTTARIKK